MAFKAALMFVTILLLSSRVSSDLPMDVWPCERYREYRRGLFCPSHNHFPPLYIWRPLPPKESDLVPLPAPPPPPLPQAYAPAPTPRAFAPAPAPRANAPAPAPRANVPTPPPRGNAPAPAPRVKPPAPAPKVAPTPAPPVPPPSSPPSDKNKPDDVIKKLITGLGAGAIMGSGLVADEEVTKGGFEVAALKALKKTFDQYCDMKDIIPFATSSY
uniref:vegetative cell wall protein gp1-like isoform X2 n=1 Tax=Fragaria vesca subsp. vesca TaxID=101020 RepID=UPI0005C95372|nr:PREDICTED: vegetative cell wall protein gp1-like isoform X2 [Fragaria vesca subsp. vesca]